MNTSLFLTLGLSLSFLSPCFGAFHSQCGQDRYVYENFFYGKRKGVFVDIGAHNGIRLSNTYFFEKEQGWSGICVEPLPEIFAELQENRKCILVKGCISDKPGIAQFFRINGGKENLEMLSGLLDKYDPRHKQRIQKSIRGKEVDCEIINVPCYLLGDLLDEHEITHINFLSLDTEGGELDILQTIDFDLYQIDVIAVENNYNDPNFLSFLNSKGFTLATTLEMDMLFVNKKFTSHSKPR